ncbi:MAG TPA: AAA family ATPase [Candidatus Obscuribacterales bacterium]
MQIERLEFIGFGKLTGQRIELGTGKLNIIVQPNEYGKSTMCDAIWAVLYDFAQWHPEMGEVKPGTAQKPLSGAAFKACLDITWQGRPMRIMRNFADRSVQVLDLSKDPSRAEADITSEFANAIKNDSFGDSITGLTRDLFCTACFVSQRQLHRQPFANDRALAGFLANETDAAGSTAGVIVAIGALEEKLAAFPYNGKTYEIAQVLNTLEERQQQLAAELARLAAERQSCDRDVDRLAEVEARLSARTREIQFEEYRHLCLEASDIDTRLAKAQERHARIVHLAEQRTALAAYETFSTEKAKTIDEMWLRRQSRLSDLNRLRNEVNQVETAAQSSGGVQTQRNEGLESFTIDDAQMISSLSLSLRQAEAELKDTKQRYTAEYGRLAAAGVNVEIVKGSRSCLLKLEPREMDELHSMHAMVVAARERASDCILSADRAQNAAVEISEGRRVLYSMLTRVFWPCLIMAVICLLPMLLLLVGQHRPLSDDLVAVVILVYLLFCSGAAASWYAADRIKRLYRTKEEEKARQEEHKYRLAANDLLAKIEGYEGRIGLLAQKAGLSSAQQLLDHLQEYAMSATQFKQLDVLELLLKNGEAQVNKLVLQIKPYLTDAQRTTQAVTSALGLALAEDINRYLRFNRPKSSPEAPIHPRLPELAFLQDELKDADGALKDELRKLNLTFTKLEDGYEQFCQAVDGHRRFGAVVSELEMLGSDSTSDLKPGELPKLVERLGSKRHGIWARMQELAASNPDFVRMPAPTEDSVLSGKQMSDLRTAVDQARAERADLIIQIRAAMKNYQDNYLKTLAELETAQRDLERVRNTAVSLTLARNMLRRLSEETDAVWADKLTEAARELVRQVEGEYEGLEFDADMSIAVRRKGQKERLDEWQISNQLSAGTREQIHWLTRLTVMQVICKSRRLPLVLDEPFSEFDDERFLKAMRYLIACAAQGQQIIVFSCHQQRHHWLLEQLDAAELQSVEVCQLTGLQANAFVRR